MKGDHRVNALGTEQGDALFASRRGLREGGDDENLQGSAILAESARGLLKDPGLDEAKDFGGVSQHGGTEGLGMPAFDHHDGALDKGQVGRSPAQTGAPRPASADGG